MQTASETELAEAGSPPQTLDTRLAPGARAHLVGIGGVSMSTLGEVLRASGVRVTGSDEKQSETTQRLSELGIPVTIGHIAQSVHGAELIIRTAAVKDDNEEIIEARRLGIPVFERADAWGHIMKAYNHAVCVSGTHGKTTTTSMLTQILMAAEMDPTVMIGGTLASLGSGYRVGGGDVIVLESCEYADSFLRFHPTLAVVLNIDSDHLDYFGTLDNVKSSFAGFAALVPSGGAIVCNADDANTMEALAPLAASSAVSGREMLTFGFSPGSDVRGEAERPLGRGTAFDIVYDERVYCHVRLGVPGRHNVMNALAASAAAIFLGLPGEVIEAGLESFTGVGRRFEFKGVINGADIYDDYSHHPTELRALFDTALALPYKRVVAAFQPHTYSRTSRHLKAFAEQLRRADTTYLAPIYAARETNTYGVSSENLASEIPGAAVCRTLEEMTDCLEREARPGDLIITVGAGELDRVGAELAKRGAAR
ncbi:MAG: UDP-N-acetylmuramate--L-alanine ligase [Oscillospiraceae bacterium]|nr:UDP-N-acetylmuramate--L-alanine ligase [Oscillospiraceae bacterium]